MGKKQFAFNKINARVKLVLSIDMSENNIVNTEERVVSKIQKEISLAKFFVIGAVILACVVVFIVKGGVKQYTTADIVVDRSQYIKTIAVKNDFDIKDSIVKVNDVVKVGDNIATLDAEKINAKCLTLKQELAGLLINKYVVMAKANPEATQDIKQQILTQAAQYNYCDGRAIVLPFPVLAPQHKVVANNAHDKKVTQKTKLNNKHKKNKKTEAHGVKSKNKVAKIKHKSAKVSKKTKVSKSNDNKHRAHKHKLHHNKKLNKKRNIRQKDHSDDVKPVAVAAPVAPVDKPVASNDNAASLAQQLAGIDNQIVNLNNSLTFYSNLLKEPFIKADVAGIVKDINVAVSADGKKEIALKIEDTMASQDLTFDIVVKRSKKVDHLAPNQMIEFFDNNKTVNAIVLAINGDKDAQTIKAKCKLIVNSGNNVPQIDITKLSGKNIKIVILPKKSKLL